MQTKLPEPLSRLIAQLAELPSIGPRQATRIAFSLISKGGNVIQSLAQGLADLSRMKICERCFFVHQNQGVLCSICADPARDQAVIMIVEKETDLISLEATGKFRGRYFITGPIPKIGTLTDAQKLRLQGLRSFVQKELGGPSTAGSGQGQAREIVLGFNPGTIGDFNATLITKELAGLAKKMSRLGRGLPTGGEIEFADDETLGSALESRS